MKHKRVLSLFLSIVMIMMLVLETSAYMPAAAGAVFRQKLLKSVPLPQNAAGLNPTVRTLAAALSSAVSLRTFFMIAAKPLSAIPFTA